MFSPNILSPGGDIYFGHDAASFIAELAHAFRNKNNSLGEIAHFVGDGLKDILTANSLGFTPKAQTKNYSDPGKMQADSLISLYDDVKKSELEDIYGPICTHHQYDKRILNHNFRRMIFRDRKKRIIRKALIFPKKAKKLLNKIKILLIRGEK